MSLLASGKDRQIILLTKRAVTEGYGKSCRVVLLFFSMCELFHNNQKQSTGAQGTEGLAIYGELGSLHRGRRHLSWTLKNRCLLGGEAMRRLQAEEGYMQVGSTAETGSGEPSWVGSGQTEASGPCFVGFLSYSQASGTPPDRVSGSLQEHLENTKK